MLEARDDFFGSYDVIEDMWVHAKVKETKEKARQIFLELLIQEEYNEGVIIYDIKMKKGWNSL